MSRPAYPGGSFLCHSGGVHDALPILARADALDDLPRLGGMARADGVAIVSERYWAFARTDGTVSTGEMPTIAPWLRRIPLVRGVARLSLSLAPMLRPRGIASGRERLSLAVVLLSPWLLLAVPGAWRGWMGAALTLGFLVWLLRGATLRLHGGEHRAIAAAELRSLVATWSGEAKPSRISPRCGTNFVALLLPITILAQRTWPLPPTLATPAVVPLVSLALATELWRFVQDRRTPFAKAALLPGLALQRLTTREPELEQTRTALRALAAVLERELA
jgi:uncharacterized protein YqhQ